MSLQQYNIDKKHTIASPISLSGKGLHTNTPTKLRILPTEIGEGISFVRTDLPESKPIPATCDYVSSTDYSTSLTRGDAIVKTVEHLLAALTGCGVDNAIIEVNSHEIPILDGSAKPFVDEILRVGLAEQNEEKKWYDITENMLVEDGESSILIVPSTQYQVTTLVDFSGTPLRSQSASLKSLSRFNSEIAAARTFGFLSEIEMLLEKGLIQGGDNENAVIIIDKKLSDEKLKELKKLLGKDKINEDAETYLQSTPLRFDNEPARHKLLDVIGDLSLCGYAFRGHIISNKPGHRINTTMAKKLKEHIQAQIEQTPTVIPTYSSTEPPVYDTVQIARMLPHRYPFLLVDKVVHLSSSRIVGLKNITINEPFFQGHFPGKPIMPGVLQVESMAQVGGLYVLSEIEQPENYDSYFLKISQCKFKRKILPGDTMLISMQVNAPTRRGITEMVGKIYVANQLCTEAVLTAQIVDRTTLL